MQQKDSGTSFLDDIIPDLNTIVLYYPYIIHGNSELEISLAHLLSKQCSGSSPFKAVPRNIIGGCGTVMTLRISRCTIIHVLEQVCFVVADNVHP